MKGLRGARRTPHDDGRPDRQVPDPVRLRDRDHVGELGRGGLGNLPRRPLSGLYRHLGKVSLLAPHTE